MNLLPPAIGRMLPELARFAAVGGTTLAIYLGLFAGLSHLGAGRFLAALCAAAVAVAVSYVLQRSWTFQSYAPMRQSLPKFVAIHASGALLNAAVVELAAGTLAIPSAYALLLGAGLYGAYSYSAQKLWCFRE